MRETYFQNFVHEVPCASQARQLLNRNNEKTATRFPVVVDKLSGGRFPQPSQLIPASYSIQQTTRHFPDRDCATVRLSFRVESS